MVAYEMLIARVPFKGNTPGATIVAQMSEPLPPAQEINPELPHSVAAMLHKALSKVPAERYESGQAFISALAAAATPVRPDPAPARATLA